MIGFSALFPPIMATKAQKTTPRESQKSYLAKRDARIAALFFREGLESRDIAVAMLADGALHSESEESAIRTVRGVVAKLRKKTDSDRAGDASPSVATNEIDALERKLALLRRERSRQETIAAGEPTEMCARSNCPPRACANTECLAVGQHIPYVGPLIGITWTNTPQGPMTSYRALWPAGVRQKASKDAALLAEKIADLEVALTSKREQIAAAERDGSGDGGLTIIESDAPIEELIARNRSVN